MKGMSMSMRRKEIKVLHSIVNAVKGRRSHRQIVLMLSLLVGLFTSLVAFILKSLVEEIQHFLTREFGQTEMNWLYLIYPAIGILITMLFIKYVVRDDIGHGVTKILYAISRKKAKIKPHNRWTSVVASSITIGFGGSVGAEAPIVLTGSAIGSNLAKRFHLPPNTVMLMVGCGAAGAIAGIFKAPIAGVMFVLEVLMLDLNMASLLSLLTTSITAVCVSYALYGTSPMFSFSLDKVFSIDTIPVCILLGILCGLVSLYFTRSMNWFERLMARIKSKWHKFFIGATLLGCLIFFLPALYGEGYDVISQLIKHTSADEIMHNTPFYGGGQNMLLIYLSLVLLMKVFASAATNAGGGCGGVFAPTLFVGALSGFVFSSVWNNLLGLNLGSTGFVMPKNCVLYGMSGLMSGVMHAPMTGIFLIAELTGGYQLFVPLMIVSVASYITINIFEPHSIYAMRLARTGELVTHDKDDAILTVLNLGNVMEKKFICLHADWDLGKIVQAVSRSHRNVFPVTDSTGKLLGIIELDDIRLYMFRSELYQRYRAAGFMKQPAATLLTSDTLKIAAAKFDETKAWNLPVTDENGRFIGFVSRSGLFNSYRQTLVNFTAM